MSLDKSRIQAICFDIDGTLNDTDDLLVKRIVPFISPIQWVFRQIDPARAARKFVLSLETPGNLFYSIPDRLGIDDEVAWLAEKLIRFHPLPPSTQLVPSVTQLLEVCSSKYPLAVISVRGKSSVSSFIERTQLSSYFRVQIHAQTCAHTKPYPDPILFAADQLGVRPYQILMVGDTTVDVLSAKRAGAQAVGVLCGFGEEKELIRAGADLTLPSTADLLQVLFPEAMRNGVED